jgi:hypothetical protein
VRDGNLPFSIKDRGPVRCRSFHGGGSLNGI